MNKKFLSAILFGALMVTSTGTFVSCKDYDEDIDGLQTQVDANKGALSALESQLTSLKADLAKAQSAADAAAAAAKAAQATGDAAKAAAEEAKKAAETAKAEAIADAAAKVEALKVLIEKNYLTAEEVETLIATVSGKIDAIGTSVNELAALVKAEDAKLLAEIAAVKADLEEQLAALKLQAGDGVSAEQVAYAIEGIQEQIGSLTNEITRAFSTIALIDEELAEIKTAVAGNQENLTTIYNELSAQIVKTNEYLDDELAKIWNEALSDANPNSLKNQIAKLTNRITDIDSQLVTLNVLVAPRLSSLVFVPSVYVNGVEAARYPYANGQYFTASDNEELTGEDDANTKYVIGKNKKNSFSKKTTEYNLGSIADVYYHLNPTNIKLDGIEWGFVRDDAEFVSRAASWNAEYVNSKAENGILAVDYKIANPEKLQAEEGLAKLSVMALQATLPVLEETQGQAVVTSDYSAIIPAVRKFNAIGYTEEDVKTEVGCGTELYKSAQAAIEAEATIPVQYNKGAINLDTYFNIHYTQADFENAGEGDEQVMTYDEAKNKWNLKFKYELISYTLGDHETSEDAYGDIKDNEFYPCYVTADGTSTHCTTEAGISAVGKKPVVLVTLVDAKDNVVLAGYVKLQIVKKVVNDNLVIAPAFELPYICGEQQNTITWKQASSQIYEFTQLSKDEFTRSYEADMTDETGASVDAYILTNGEFKATSKYGKVEAVADADQGTTNDLIKWTGDKADLDEIGIGKSVTLYVKYKSTSDIYNYYYIGIKLTVLAKPEVTLGEKIDARWFNNETLVKVSVPAPVDNGDVTKFQKDMDDNFVGGKVVVTPTSAAQNVKYGEFEKLAIAYNHQFAATQNKVGDYQLMASKDRSQVYDAKTKNLVARINKNSGIVTYADNDIAKAVLNLYAYDDTENAFDLNMEIVTTYGGCNIPLKNETYAARIQRPVNIVKGSNAKFIDAQANGSSVVLGDLISLTDWRGNTPLIKKGTNGYEAAIENKCNLYSFYQFKTVTVDVEKATCNLNGKVQMVNDVTDSFELTSDAENAAEISDVNVFNTIKITYSNNEGNVQAFKLWIPVTIEYAWGKLTTTIEADVQSTKGSN